VASLSFEFCTARWHRPWQLGHNCNKITNDPHCRTRMLSQSVRTVSAVLQMWLDETYGQVLQKQPTLSRLQLSFGWKLGLLWRNTIIEFIAAMSSIPYDTKVVVAVKANSDEPTSLDLLAMNWSGISRLLFLTVPNSINFLWYNKSANWTDVKKLSHVMFLPDCSCGWCDTVAFTFKRISYVRINI